MVILADGLFTSFTLRAPFGREAAALSLAIRQNARTKYKVPWARSLLPFSSVHLLNNILNRYENCRKNGRTSGTSDIG